MSVVQNLALPFTLDIEPPPGADRARAEALAQEVGLSQTAWTRPLAELDANAAARVRLGRAIALDPALLLLEHATARLAREAAAPFGAAVRAIGNVVGSKAAGGQVVVGRDPRVHSPRLFGALTDGIRAQWPRYATSRLSRIPFGLPSMIGELAASPGRIGNRNRIAECSRPNSSSPANGRLICMLCRFAQPCPLHEKIRSNAA